MNRQRAIVRGAIVLALALVAGGGFWLWRQGAGQFIREVAKGALESPAVADLSHVRKFERAGYAVEYPGNWRLDDDDDDFDPDRFIDINAPAQGKVMLMFLPGASAAEVLQKAQREQERLFIGGVRKRPFSKWGTLDGRGIELIGALVVAAGRIRIFVHETERLTVAAVEVRYDEDERFNARGYDLIARSLALRP